MNRGEALNAYYEGEKVKLKSWPKGVWIQKYAGRDDLSIDEHGNTRNENDTLSLFADADWELYEEPAKSLSFDDAATAPAGTTIQIDFGQGGTFRSTRMASGWTWFDIVAFDLAERRGYRMERVD